MKALLAVMLGVPRLAACGADAQEARPAAVAPVQVRAAYGLTGQQGPVLPRALPAGATVPVAPRATAAPGQR
ncbi:hypothetical protein BKK79_32700 [Cupriavidus sp. USMAA2-4]|uniref:hypothetical protein n=1 Tax=Cupriavidus sp. USMAA2-4 TaxID=876364 RepID=UPI0008A6AF2D|nr:hypothetical protein [Cupriavidus sp. USMAA2-4]AOY96354.1 hypothetical protein BKK79_32700 [Cupriavidus sp. USMAA2-4]